ncbi:MAG: response regulator [Nannocystis sp.]|nr:response regulator [Nannocystis sp.]
MADLTSSERRRRLTETSLVSMSLLELRPQANEGIGDEATVQHRFIRLTSLVLALLVPLAAGLGYLSVGPHLFTGATTTVVALYFVSLLLLHLLARRRRGRWLAYALVALINGLPLLLAALHHDPITRISLVVLMIPAVVIASPLLGPRHGVALALIDIACNIGLLLATRSQLSPALNAAAELWTLRVSVALLATAGVGWFFARGLHQLIDASQSAHSSLLARAQRQGVLAHLGQRALRSFDDLVRSILRRAAPTLGISGCAFIERVAGGRWRARLSDAEPVELEIAPASFLAEALATPGTHALELGDEAPLPALRRSRCVVVSAALADRPAALLAWARGPQPLTTDEIPFLETLFNLLSTAHQRERALALQSASEARYAELVALSPDGIVTFDERGAVTTCNPAAAAMLGRAAPQLVGVLLNEGDLLAPEERGRWQRSLSSLFAGEQLSARILELLTPSGRRRHLEVHGRLAQRDDGSREVVAILRDVTERHLLEEQLRAAQRLESLGLLAGGVAHDFNNVLTVVLTSAALLESDDRLPPDLRELTAEITDAGERAADLTRQLLAFGRRQHLTPGPVDLAEAITALQKLLRRLIGEDIELHVELTRDLGTVHVDRSQLEQALINLCVNARAAMPSGGHLTIATRARDLSQKGPLERPGLAPGRYAEIFVRDDGVGMAPTTLSRIFEPFFTTKGPGEGTGLGLAMVHGFVEQSGGQVWAESTLGEGSTFRILLPLGDGDEGITRAQKALRIQPGRGRILLVEDEPLVRAIAARILIRAGYEVLQCEGPTEAIRAFADADIDLIVSDVVMPDMSGPALVERLRAQRPRLRAIFVSGYPRGQQGESLPLDGATFVQKPFTPEALSRAVHAALGADESGSRA